MKKNILIISVVAIVLVIVYLVVRKRKEEASGYESSSSTQNLQSSNVSAPPASSSFPIKKGSSGSSVKYLQNLLNAKYSTGLVVDGVFGTATETALFEKTGKKQIKNAIELMRLGTGKA